MGSAFAHKTRLSHAETTATLSQTRYAHIGPHPGAAKWGYNGLGTLASGNGRGTLGLALADSLEGVQVDQDIGQRVVVRD